jgi:hypothetical protein
MSSLELFRPPEFGNGVTTVRSGKQSARALLHEAWSENQSTTASVHWLTEHLLIIARGIWRASAPIEEPYARRCKRYEGSVTSHLPLPAESKIELAEREKAPVKTDFCFPEGPP